MTRILIVDDNATNLKLAADVLANPRCEVLRASDAREALEILALRRPDLILMDLAMPGTDGLSLTRRIKADARYCELPIVALTASAMKGDDQRALEAGCEGYITKPIDTRRFRQQVMAFLPSETDAEPAAPVATTARAGLRIHAVDDSAQGHKLLRAGLENERCTVIEASNGREALDLLERQPVDAVVSDILMPQMDGFRLCREIRGSGRGYAAVPFLLYTATYDSPQDRQLAKAVGADDYLLKPAPAGVILETLRNLRSAGQRSAAASAPTPAAESEVLEQYNAVLVRKLESRNQEVQQAWAQLQQAHEHAIGLNRYLEMRVEQRTAALDAANRELEAFAHSVAHDLRAPLQQIAGFAELMLERQGRGELAEQGEHLGYIVGAARRLDRLVVDLLGLARSSVVGLDLRDVDLDRVLDEAFEAIRGELSGRTIHWKREPLPQVRGDAGLLRQVFVNLLSNAVKFTRSRAAATIEVGRRAGRSHEVVLYVRDDGVGFDVQQAERLFGAFQRLPGTGDYEGDGIGLANVKRIITRHGGRVWAESAPGKGATFFFSLAPAEPEVGGAR